MTTRKRKPAAKKAKPPIIKHEMEMLKRKEEGGPLVIDATHKSYEGIGYPEVEMSDLPPDMTTPEIVHSLQHPMTGEEMYTEGLVVDKPDVFCFNTFTPHLWTCSMFGMDGGFVLNLANDKQPPNWFWRKMQYLILGNKWVKQENNK